MYMTTSPPTYEALYTAVKVGYMEYDDMMYLLTFSYLPGTSWYTTYVQQKTRKLSHDHHPQDGKKTTDCP